jgi:hypothetical protein
MKDKAIDLMEECRKKNKSDSAWHQSLSRIT